MRITLPVSVPGSDVTASASPVENTGPTSAKPVTGRMRLAFSLTGLVPLGAFLVAHLAMNARVLAGGTAFAAAVRAIHRVPALALVEALFVFAPLCVHAAIGAWLVATRRSLEPAAPYSRAVRVAMRVTGIVVLAFLAMHLPELRFRGGAFADSRLDGSELGTVLDAELSAVAHGVPWRGLAYLVGTACVVVHFVGGLWGFLATTEAGRADPARLRKAAWIAIAVGVVMWGAFADVVVLRATGARLFGSVHPDPTSELPCPPPEGTPR